MNLLFTKVKDVKSPTRAHKDDAGIDFYVPNVKTAEDGTNYTSDYIIAPQRSVLIPSGIKAKIPSGHALVFMNKSGVSTKKGLVVGACVVDENYEGEMHIHLINTGVESVKVELGAKIVQGVILPINYAQTQEISNEEYEALCGSERGSGGFGSTGA